MCRIRSGRCSFSSSTPTSTARPLTCSTPDGRRLAVTPTFRLKASPTEHPAPSAAAGTGGHQSLDPFVALSHVAAVTTDLKLLTYLAVLPYRNPASLAKSCNGRQALQWALHLGSAPGISRRSTCWRRLPSATAVRRALDVMPLHWSGEPFDYEALQLPRHHRRLHRCRSRSCLDRGNAKLTLRRGRTRPGMDAADGPAGMFDRSLPEVLRRRHRACRCCDLAGDRFADLDIACVHRRHGLRPVDRCRAAPARSGVCVRSARRGWSPGPTESTCGRSSRKASPTYLVTATEPGHHLRLAVAYAAALPCSWPTTQVQAVHRYWRPASNSAGHLRICRRCFRRGLVALGWPASRRARRRPACAAMFQTLWTSTSDPRAVLDLEILVPVLLVFALIADELLPGLPVATTCGPGFLRPTPQRPASLRTCLEPDGDGYRLHGQKVWSTFGHLSQRSVLLAPGGPGTGTDDGAGRSRPARRRRAPGYRAEDGENPGVFDGAFVPKARHRRARQGWAVACTCSSGNAGVGVDPAGPFPQATRATRCRSPSPHRHAASIGHRLHLMSARLHRETVGAWPARDSWPRGLRRQVVAHRCRDGDVEHHPRAHRSAIRRRPRTALARLRVLLQPRCADLRRLARDPTHAGRPASAGDAEGLR